MNPLERLNAWVLAEDVRTWVFHALIALGIALLLSPQIAVGYYALREAEQVFYRLIEGKRLHPLDHIMDVLSPAVAVGGLVLIEHLS